MPYINQAARDRLEASLDTLVERIHDYSPDHEGILNYAISALVARSMRPKTGWHYTSAYRAYGTFLAAAAEFYRRILVPVEGSAIMRNGDLPEYGE